MMAQTFRPHCGGRSNCRMNAWSLNPCSVMKQHWMLPFVLTVSSVTTAATIFDIHHVPIKDITASCVGYKDCRTRFTIRRPAAENVLSILFGGVEGVDVNRLGRPRFNHDSVGITESVPLNNLKNDIRLTVNGETICRSDIIDGWRVLRFYKRLGSGKKCYRRLQQAAFNWNFDSRLGYRCMGIVAAQPQAEKEKGAKNSDVKRGFLATFTELRFPGPFKSLFIVNPVHVVRESRDVKRQGDNCVFSSTSYATLHGHLLAGEEKVTVIWRKGVGNEVDVEIISCSRSAPSLVAKAIWPLIGRIQKQFFLAEMDHFESIAKV